MKGSINKNKANKQSIKHKIANTFKRTKVSYGNLDFNKVARTTEYKRINKENRLFKAQLNGKTQYYIKYFGVYKDRSDVLYLSVPARKKLKAFPEISDFVKRNLFTLETSAKNKRVVNNKSFENNNLKIDLNRLTNYYGMNNTGLYKMEIFYKKLKRKERYFIKLNENKKGRFLGDEEFIANQRFQKVGINTIKPHFAFVDKLFNRSIIVYNFTNLLKLDSARKQKIITESQYWKIIKTAEKLSKYKEEIGLWDRTTTGVGDFESSGNIFIVKKNNKNIDIYFTDLLIGLKNDPHNSV